MDLRAAASQIKSIWIKEKSGFPLFLRFIPAGRSCVLNFPQQREREILCDGRGLFAVQLEIPGAAVVGRVGDRTDREERDAVRVADMRDRGRLHIHGERRKARVDFLPAVPALITAFARYVSMRSWAAIAALTLHTPLYSRTAGRPQSVPS